MIENTINQEMIEKEKKEIKKYLIYTVIFILLFYGISIYVENKIMFNETEVNIAKDFMVQVSFAFLMLVGAFMSFIKAIICLACLSFLKK